MGIYNVYKLFNHWIIRHHRSWSKSGRKTGLPSFLKSLPPARLIWLYVKITWLFSSYSGITIHIKSDSNDVHWMSNFYFENVYSEEIFDFSAEQMTQQKTNSLKNQMCGEFSEIFQLCKEVLDRAQKPSLIKATLQTLLRFLNWIPLGFIFETDLIETLTNRVCPHIPLNEIMSLHILTVSFYSSLK